MTLYSVNTNRNAMIALQNLNVTGSELGVAQQRISTGRKVDSAKDNGSTWAIAQSMRATSTSLNGLHPRFHGGQPTHDGSNSQRRFGLHDRCTGLRVQMA